MTTSESIICPCSGSANQPASDCQACGGPLQGVAPETHSETQLPTALYDEIEIPASVAQSPGSSTDDVQKLARTAS